MNKSITLFKFWILVIFVVLEALLFKTNDSLKLTTTIIEYIFVIFIFAKNKEVGIMYFFSFILLTVGLGNYSGYESEPINFWGIRIFGFSLSIITTFIITLAILLKDRFKFPEIKNNGNYIFFLIFVSYCSVVGIIRYIQGINYLDNYFYDLMTFFPAIIYIILIYKVSFENILLMVKYLIPLTLIQMLISSISGNKFVYGVDEFVLSNSLYLIFPIALLFFKDFYKLYQWIIMIVLMLFFLASGQYFISGKFIVLCVMVLIWYMTKGYRILFMLIPTVLIIYNLEYILLVFESLFSDNSVIVFKFSQIRESLSTISDPYVIASTPTSIGNIFAEYLTVYKNVVDNISFFVFGKGFGGGVPDYWGFLIDGAGETAYAAIDATRNDYFKMHLPIYDVVLKGGIFFLGYYLIMLYKAIQNRTNMGLIFFLLLFTVFAVSKEMLLLTLIFIRLLSENKINLNAKFNYI